MRIFTWRHRLIVLAVNGASLALFLGGGYLLDGVFGIRPTLTFVGLLVSFLVGQFVLTKLLRHDVRSRMPTS